MASRTKPSRLQSEIEKCRVEGQWAKVLDLVKQFSAKNTGLDYYVHFILGESNLEKFAKDNLANEQNASKAKDQLADAQRHLNIVLKENGKMHMAAILLLAKAHYYQGAYQTALTLFDSANLDTVTVPTSSIRLLHIVAEAHAIKGLCLEKLPSSSTSKFKVAEKEEKILACFEMAGDLALLYLQEKDKTWGSQQQLSSSLPHGTVLTEPESSGIGDILEKAIQQSPIYYIKHGELEKGIKRFRDLLQTVESRYSQQLRLTLARQLAEVLLRGVCEGSYSPPNMSAPPTKTTKTGFTPKKYANQKVFIPQSENEEALLLLLIAEAVATREAILNRTSEHQEARLHTFHNASAVFDLMAIALVKRAQFNKLVDSFERAMKFSFEEYHIWTQFANSLICARKYERALAVLMECHRLRPKQVLPVLQAAKICYEHLHKYDEGIQFSEMALSVDENHPMASRACVALGIGYSMKAMQMKLKGQRQELHAKALKAFQRAHVLDPNDYLSLFHLALQMAILRQIEEAVKYTKLSLKYYSDHIHSLHLLVLLLTAQKQFQDAMDLVNAALEEYPDNISLLLTKSKIEEVVYGPEIALTTCKKMMTLWKDLHEIHADSKGVVDVEEKKHSLTMTDRSQFDKRSQAFLQLNEFTDRDSVPFSRLRPHDRADILDIIGGSIRAESLAVSRIEQTLSDHVASSLAGSSVVAGASGSRTLKLQCQIWMNLSELYLSLDKVEEAESCVQETSSLFPLSHQVAFMRGRIFEHKQKFSDAKSCYEDAVSINPSHQKSLQHLGMVLHYLDNNQLAEKVFRDAVNLDPTSNKSWYCLGLVLDALHQSEAAVNCQLTALDLEASSPIVPFTVIPHLMQ